LNSNFTDNSASWVFDNWQNDPAALAVLLRVAAPIGFTTTMTRNIVARNTLIVDTQMVSRSISAGFLVQDVGNPASAHVITVWRCVFQQNSIQGQMHVASSAFLAKLGIDNADYPSKFLVFLLDSSFRNNYLDET
jgi:hypothetical protein